ncbi:SDR family oxidoreductase [Halobaculum limi]|uniref:SDR family oxidoreductase n=1 Tax=Halobaculum limi TaxID=3031916 RepID=UPI00240705D7|nr:NAD(P)H-binding protein [Halobaculum sp. YSMS11]
MDRVLLTGATGTLGRQLRPRLLDAGYRVTATSRTPDEVNTAGAPSDQIEWTTMDLRSGDGITTALADVDSVIHTATAPRGDTEAVDVAGTKRLLAAADDTGVDRVWYVSIVGIDAIPYSYYQHKLAAEQAVAASDVPSTIVRSTQFHTFLDGLFSGLSRLPVWPLPTGVPLQPIAAADLADVIVEHLEGETADRLPPVGGPVVQTVGSLAKTYREQRDLWRPIVPVPVPGSTAAAFRAGHATCPEHVVGTETWPEWLEREYGDRRHAWGESTSVS